MLANPVAASAAMRKSPEPSPVKTRPVRLAPWAAGASPTRRRRASGSPNPATGRPQYVSLRWAAFLSRAIPSQYRRSRGQSWQSAIAWRTEASEVGCASAVRVTFTSFNGVSRLAPGAHAAIHGDDVGVAHLLQVVGRQGGAKAAPTVEDDRRVMVGDHRLDIALEHPAADVSGAPGPVDRELAVLADVDEVEPFAPVEPGLHGRDVALLDARLRVVYQGEESRAMLHGLKDNTATSL